MPWCREMHQPELVVNLVERFRMTQEKIAVRQQIGKKVLHHALLGGKSK